LGEPGLADPTTLQHAVREAGFGQHIADTQPCPPSSDHSRVKWPIHADLLNDGNSKPPTIATEAIARTISNYFPVVTGSPRLVHLLPFDASSFGANDEHLVSLQR
jgi:hypothetical protein